MFDLVDVHKSFGAGHLALRHTSLRFAPGETTALIGPSGCGKSTTLRLLCGLLEPDGGQILWRGEPMRPTQAWRRQIGYVIQGGGLFPHMSARQNVTLGAKLAGWSSDRMTARVELLGDLCELTDQELDRHPGHLSGGQAQRVALMRALMLEPSALLLDEPLGALDPMVRDALQEQLGAIFAQMQMTVILVTHDVFEADRLAHTIALMKDGAVVQHGSMKDLTARPAHPFVTRFLQVQHPKSAP